MTAAATDFLMPTLGADMQAGTLVAWRKRPGEAVHRGEILAEVDTEKGVIDVEVFHDSVLDEIVVPVGGKVPVGTVIARMRGGGEPEPSIAPLPVPIPPAPTPPVPTSAAPAAAVPPEPGVAAQKPSVSAAPARPPAADRLARMRQTIAAAMSRSKREIPHYYLATTIDLHRATTWLAEVNAARPIDTRLLPGVLLLKATALALRETPELNAVWEQERVVLRDTVHVGVAISLRGGGLVILALHDTATRSLDDLMAGLRGLTARARAGRVKSSELADSTITVTSLGDRGVESVYGVIYPPQVAIVGFGKIVERPWAVDGGVQVRPVVTATLAADHRVSDGHRGGLFLEAVERLLQEPEKL
jgi:pyruvate dehydrogenase E2 component (dihydrolipoamide acetyltransferase)